MKCPYCSVLLRLWYISMISQKINLQANPIFYSVEKYKEKINEFLEKLRDITGK